MMLIILIFLLCCAAVVPFVLFAPADPLRFFRSRVSYMVLLFSVIFSSAAAFYINAQHFLDAENDIRSRILLLVLIFFFFGTGGNILYELYLKKRMFSLNNEKLKRQFPDLPWKWDSRWQDGIIAYSNKGEVIFSWTLTVVIIMGLIIIFLERKTHSLEWIPNAPWGDRCVNYTLVMAGLFSIRYAINTTTKWLEFGISSFRMHAVPGIIGGTLEGTVQTHCRKVPCDGFEVKLSCVELDLSFKESPSEILEKVLWKSEKITRIENIRMGTSGIFFPVSFTIPELAQETDSWSPQKRIHWVLNVTACGGDHVFRAVFKVPVFRAPQSSVR